MSNSVFDPGFLIEHTWDFMQTKSIVHKEGLSMQMEYLLTCGGSTGMGLGC